MQIGELAQRTGASGRSIRYYEQQGLLETQRTGRGWRTYDARGAPGAERRGCSELGCGWRTSARWHPAWT